MTETAAVMDGHGVDVEAPRRFTDPRGPARWAVRALRVSMAAGLGRAVLALGYLMVLRSMEQGGNPARMHAALEGADVVVLPLATLGEFAALFCCTYWLARAHANLPALGARRLRYSPHWAISGWLIPIANLALPYLVTHETWRASVPGRDGTEWRTGRGGPRVAAWWALVLLTLALAFGIAAPGAGEAVSYRAQYALLTVMLLNAMAGLFASIAALRVVREVNERQLRTAGELGLSATG
jgi:hypothetical protein